MKKHSILLIIIVWSTNLFSQFFPANGIGYQAMLTQAEKVTYGTKLENVPVANQEISARFELLQSGNSVFEDFHRLKTDKNGIFSCIIGTGQITPFGSTLSSINWQKDSVVIRVFIDAGEGESLFSEQKLWSTAYAMYAHRAGSALNDKDTNSTNELQYLNLVGDSITLTSVAGGISLKPWSDAISNNSQAITAEKLRAEAAELDLQNQISGINVTLGNKTTELSAAQDTLVKFRSEINGIKDAISQNQNNISTNKTDISANTSAIKDHSDSIAVHRSELNKNRSDITKNTADINQNKTDIATNKSNISTNTTDIATNKSDIATNKTDISNNTTSIRKNSDTLVVHRTELNKNRGDINKNIAAIAQNKTDIATNKSNISTNTTDIATNKSGIATNKTDISNNSASIRKNSDTLVVHRTELNKNRGDINKNTTEIAKNTTDLAQHINNDKDTDNTNELSDLSYNNTTFELKLSNPSTTGNKVDLSGLRDNLGNHKATDTLDLNGQVLTDRSGDTLLIAVSGNDIDLTLESEDEIFIRTVNNPNNATHGDIQLESSDEVIIKAETDVYINAEEVIDIVGGDDVTIEALGDDITLESSDDIKIYSGEDVFISGQNVIEISSGGGDNITIDSDNDIELKTTANDYVEIWTDGSFMYTLPNKRGSIGQFLQRSSDGSSEYFTDWSDYKMPTTDGTNGQALITDGNGNVTWGNSTEVDGSTTNELQDLSFNSTTKKLTLSTPKTTGNEVDLSSLGGASKLDDLSDVKGPNTNFNKSLLIGNTTTGTLNNANGNVGMGHLVFRKLSSGDNNTVYGAEAGMDIDASFNNTLIGYQAGHKVSTQSYNTAIGAAALFRNSAGQQNVAVGQGAGSALLGSFTTSIGSGAASGNSSVTTNSGDNNTYIGFGAQPTSSTVSNEIVLGNQSVTNLYTAGKLKTGTVTYPNTHNSSNGQVLTVDASGNATWQSASGGGASKLDDLSDVKTYGTGSVMLGSTTTGTIINANHNFSSGQNALKMITTGDNNISIGYNTLDAITTSGNLVAMGYSALGSCTTATNSIAIGYGALSGALKSSDNIAIGNVTMTANVTGYGNTAVGYSALSKVINFLNTAIGYNAGKNTQTSGTNTYFGGYNTYMGAFSGENNTIGSHNTTFGFKAMWIPGSYTPGDMGDGNTAFGSQALWSNTGERNVAIGNGSNMSSSANNPPLAFTGTNTITIGNGSQPTSLSVSNEARLGNNSITSLRSQVSLTTTSDERVKENISENVVGLAFINKLRPVTYNYSLDKMNDLQQQMGFEVDSLEYEGKRDIEKIRFSGFIAQEVESAAAEVNYAFSGVDKPKTEGAIMGLRYSEFVVPLVKATQEQQKLIENQTKLISEQQEIIKNLLERVEALENATPTK